MPRCQPAVHHPVYPQPPVPGPVSMPPMCSKARAQLLSSQSFPLAKKTNCKQVRLTLRCENCCQGCASLNRAPGLAQMGRGGEGSLELDSERGSSGRGQPPAPRRGPTARIQIATVIEVPPRAGGRQGTDPRLSGWVLVSPGPSSEAPGYRNGSLLPNHARAHPPIRFAPPVSPSSSPNSRGLTMRG